MTRIHLPKSLTERNPLHKGSSADSNPKRLRFGDVIRVPGLALARAALADGSGSAEAQAVLLHIRCSLPRECELRMTTYRPELPEDQTEQIRPFVENAVAIAQPLTSYSVVTLLRPAMHFTHWAVFVIGVELTPTSVFDRGLIEHYVRETMPNLTEGTRRNYRAWLFRVAEAVNPEANPRNPMPLNARELEVPYSPDELDALDRWAAGQTTQYMRSNAAALLALGIGGGVTAGEIARLRVRDLQVGGDGMVTVSVRAGGQPREVVVWARYETVLANLHLDAEPDQLALLARRTAVSRDVVSAFVERCHNPPGTPTVRARKMRNTWLVHHLSNRIDVTSLMKTAGLQSLESISRLTVFVPAVPEQALAAQLRGNR